MAWPAAVSGEREGDPSAKDPEGVRFFEQQIAPILQRRCYACHSHQAGKAKGGLVLDSRHGWETGGASGPAIVPGQPDDSLLIDAVRYRGFEMPPEEPLPAAELRLLEAWVARGAPDPRSASVRAFDPQKLWALQPIALHPPPTVRNEGWARSGMDHFLLRELEAAGLEPAQDADRYTLLRRVTLDLTGLPPTPEEIEAFVADRSEGAYERVVDRLLASPSFGDRWARHWFDLSCYADLADVSGNMLIRDAWRYRDYVIAAFNADKPLDRFIHEQIAGDLLPYETLEQRHEQIVATGYLANGPWVLQNYIKGQLAADVVDHQIDRIGRTFLGQTIACARCHDHKFDPIPTRDYYALAGIFHSTLTTSYDGPGVWSQIHHVTLPEVPEAAAEFARLGRIVDRQRQTLVAERDALNGEEAADRFTRKVVRDPGNALTLQTGVAANEAGQEYRFSFAAGPSVWAAADQATRDGDGLLVQLLRPDGTVLAHHLHRPRPWSGSTDAQRLDDATFTYRGDGSGTVTVHLTASDTTGRFGGAIDDLRIVETSSGQVRFAENFNTCQFGSIQGKQFETGLTVYAGCSFAGWTGSGVNHSHAVDRGTPGTPNFALQLFSGPAASGNPRVAEIERKLDQLRERLEAARPDRQQTLAVRDIERPQDHPIYRRGDFQSPGEVVPRGFLSAVPVAKPLAIPPDSSGRLQLAFWLTDPGNPLTSRVLVNRVWHHLFGTGLVRSVDYFGVHGETPSHPELLDYLARQLREDDHWSLKATVRRMVLSRTYQMGSTANARGWERDPDNRLLWRMPRRRLTAEAIRDAMLATSGQLDRGRGGSSLGLEVPGNIQGLGGNVNPPTWGGKIADGIRNRRSIYLPFKRERPQEELEILSVFDFPHPSDITGARPQTTVATQAVFLLNAPFVKQQAARLAERLATEVPDDERARIDRLYLLAVSRPADLEEITMAADFLDGCAEDLTGGLTVQDARAAAWVQLCHALLGSNRFLFCE